MSPPIAVLVFLVLLLLSATFSGSETGSYSLSRVRLEAEAKRGGRTARLLSYLLRDDALLLITLLIGNNLVIELLTELFRHELAAVGAVPDGIREIVVALVLTPILFFFGELLPKDMFRRRPRFFLGASVGVVALSRLAFLPLAMPMKWLSQILERVLRVRADDFTRALGREEILEFLRQGAREGTLEPHAEELVQNVFVLRSTPVAAVMEPWRAVTHVDLERPEEEVRRAIEEAPFTRLPALATTSDGGRSVVGYLNQLDVLGDPGRPLAELVRPIPSLGPETSLDRGLARLQLAGQRVALVGPPEAPLGLVGMMDLVAAIAGMRAPRFSGPSFFATPPSG